MTLRTDRLLLRQWRDADRSLFATMNADREVMRWFPEPLSRTASDALADRIEAHIDEHGWGLWAVEVVETGDFVGFVGLAPDRLSPATRPQVEVGWRLRRDAWGRGYATEAGRAALDHAFTAMGLDEVVSVTTAGNERSRTVMRRLGLRHDSTRDFDHPDLGADHPLQPMVLHAIDRADWAADPPAGTGSSRDAGPRLA